MMDFIRHVFLKEKLREVHLSPAVHVLAVQMHQVHTAERDPEPLQHVRLDGKIVQVDRFDSRRGFDFDQPPV